jgi:hypothetical protein
MSERCANCGAELFAGQQFCRACGAALREPGDESPTQLFPPPAAPPTGTVRLDPRGTDPVRDPRPTGYQPPVYQPSPPAAFGQTAPLGRAATRRGRGVWFVALVAVAVVSVLATLAVVFAIRARQRSQQRVIVKQGGVGVGRGVVPPVPPDLPERVREAVESSGVPLPVDETDVTVSDDETTFTKSYPLGAGASVSVKNLKGDITVEGWEQPVAEVTVVKSGGDAHERMATRVLLSKTGEQLWFSAAPAGRDVSVSYHLKLPRDQRLRQVEIVADTGNVKVGGLEGTVVVDVKTGELEFEELSGPVRGKLIKGDVLVGYGVNRKRGPHEYTVVRGNVKVTFGAYPKADLKAETMDGEIETDHTVPLDVLKTAGGGRHVAGRLTVGGAPLLIKVVNGDIELKN